MAAMRSAAEARRVLGPAVLDRSLRRLLNGRRCLEVRLAELEVDDVDALALERLGALEHLDGEEGVDGLHPARESHQRARAGGGAGDAGAVMPAPGDGARAGSARASRARGAAPRPSRRGGPSS